MAQYGGGHHITREDYDVDLLISEIKRIRETYNLEIYIEPGEAIALNAGYLATEVLDIVENGMEILVLDASATCHMPDVLGYALSSTFEKWIAARKSPYL